MRKASEILSELETISEELESELADWSIDATTEQLEAHELYSFGELSFVDVTDFETESLFRTLH